MRFLLLYEFKVSKYSKSRLGNDRSGCELWYSKTGFGYGKLTLSNRMTASVAGRFIEESLDTEKATTSAIPLMTPATDKGQEIKGYESVLLRKSFVVISRTVQTLRGTVTLF